MSAIQKLLLEQDIRIIVKKIKKLISKASAI